VRGYDALMIGETVFVSGVAMFLTAPLAGRLSVKVDPRYMLISGFLLFAIGTFWLTYITKDWDFWELFWPQVFRGMGLMLSIVPINNIALGTLPPERLKNAAGLYNLMRNLGGAVGLALLTTILNDRTDLHLARLHESVTWSRQPALETLNSFVQRFSSYGGDAQAMALKQLNKIVHQQGVVMAFADVFLVLTFLFVGLAVLALVMKRPAAAGAAGGGH
jgi:DHA2 family multidrug resistance protein